MSKLAPNLHVLRYLNATNRLTDEIKNRAVENIKIGAYRNNKTKLKVRTFHSRLSKDFNVQAQRRFVFGFW